MGASCLLCNCIFDEQTGLDNPASAAVDSASNCAFPTVNEELEGYVKIEVDDDDICNGNASLLLNGYLGTRTKSKASIANQELQQFVAYQFSIVNRIQEFEDVQDNLTFCKSCLAQLIKLKMMQAQLISIQKQFQQLKKQIAADFNKTYLSRKEVMRVNKVEADGANHSHSHSMHNEETDRLGPLDPNFFTSSLQVIPDIETDNRATSLCTAKLDEQMEENEDADEEEYVPSPATNTFEAFEETTLPNQQNDLESEFGAEHTSRTIAKVRECRVSLVRLDPTKLPKAKRGGTTKKPRRKRSTLYRIIGGPFKCEVCSKMIRHRDRLRLHMRIHTGEKPHKCKYCDKSFCRIDNLKEHLTVHSKEKNHSCHICGVFFRTTTILKKHLAYQHDIFATDPIHCNLCTRKFLRPAELTNHIASAHAHGPSNSKPGRKRTQSTRDNSHSRRSKKVQISQDFSCDACEGLKFTLKVLLKEHRVKHHNIGEDGKGVLRCPNPNCKATFIIPKNYEEHKLVCCQPRLCDTCGLSFDDETLLIKHKVTHRAPEHICEICGAAFLQNFKLLAHKRISHDGYRPAKCKQCSETFKCVSSLKCHMVKHTGLKLYTCKYCDERFSIRKRKSQHEAEKHAEIHLLVKSVICPICWRNFKDDTELSEHHEKVHDKFTCKECSKIFSGGPRYRKHMLIHTGEKPYHCTYCPKAFNKRENLKEHVFRHTGERPFRCEKCGLGFFRRKELEKHQKSHEPN